MPTSRLGLMQDIAILRMMLDLNRIFGGVYFTGDNFGSRATDGLLLAAVMIGQAEGRLMNASKLSEYAGIPRPTVIRRLSELGKLGYVQRGPDGFVIATPILRRSTAAAATAKAVRLVKRTAALLSRMDT